MEVKIKEVLKRELKNRGESLSHVAKKTKIPLSTLHGWSTGVLPTAKNLHLIKTLSDYFGISIATILFNVHEETSKEKILFSSEFTDELRRYRLVIEKLEK